MKPLISVCLPNYNYEKFIGEAIESVLSQTFRDFELIIADNASTDSSIEIIKSYNDERIRLFRNEENIPLYQNINNCINHSRGELIAILHSDDKYKPDFLKEIVSAYQQNPSSKVFVTGVNIWHSDENRIMPVYPYSRAGIKTQSEILIRLAKENNIGNGVNVVFHRECLILAGMFSSRYSYSADYDLWFRLAEKFDFVYIPQILAYYRIHGSNISHTANKNIDMFKESINICRENLSESKIIPPKLKNLLDNIYQENSMLKAFHMGIKYKDGSITRKMLDHIAELNISIKHYPYWHIIYFLSGLIKQTSSDISTKIISIAGKLLLYNCNFRLKAAIENLLNRYREIAC